MNLSDVINEAVLEKHKKEFEKETLTTDEELANMRNLVQQLRNDSAKMVETLRDLSMRNAVLERDHTSFQVFKKGAMIEIDGLRHELDRGRMNIELLITDKSMLENEVAALKKELSSRNSSGSVSSSSENGDDDEKEEDEEDKVHELEVLRMKVRDLEYIVEHFACPMSADPRQQMELEQK